MIRAEAEDMIQFVGPLEPVVRDRIGPASNVGDALSFAEVLFALSQGLVDALAVGDIAGDGEDLALVEQREGVPGQPSPGAVLASITDFETQDGLSLGQAFSGLRRWRPDRRGGQNRARVGS